MSVAGAVQGGSDFIDATRDGALQGTAPGARSLSMWLFFG
jgi:hypothetical protein